MPPERLGPYRLERRIGRGGMGTVFAAVNDVTGERAAVKVLSPSYIAGVEGFPDRFAGEIESLKLLRHPNIVQILGYGEEGDYRYYAMELIDGASLQDALDAQRTFTWQEAVRLIVQICRALKHAHDRGVVHRDLKPANLLLAADGIVKLSDFGIAKLFGHTGLTTDGGVVGTAEYMAPEQADSKPATARSDLYSLGGVLYALLAGRPPFRAKSVVDMLQLQRFADPEPIARVRPGVPSELNELVTQLLQKDPARRPASALVVLRQLEHLPARAPIADVPERPIVPPTRAPQPSQDAALDAESPTRDVMPHELPPREGARPQPPVSPALTTDFQVAPAAPLSAALGGRETTNIPHRLPSRLYTAVDGDAVRRPDDDVVPGWRSPVVWVLAASVVGIAALGWYWLRPPSADALYHELSTAAADGEMDGLAGAETKLRDFLKRFPNDPRAGEIQSLLDDIELDRLERRFEVRAKSNAAGQRLTPVERAYLEAIAYARLEPARGRKKLQAVVDLFGRADDDSKQSRDCLQLARKQLERLAAQERGDATADNSLIDKQLDDADRLDAADPATAAGIRRAVVELYGDEPWAEAAVARARKALEASAKRVAGPIVTEPSGSGYDR